MAKTTIEDLARLPKWAQRRIQSLEGSVTHWRDKALETASEGEGTNTVTRIGINEFRYLPSDSLVQFKTPDGNHIDVRVKDGIVDIIGSSALIVEPVAGNHIHVSVND
jgi:hypothetical protein